MGIVSTDAINDLHFEPSSMDPKSKFDMAKVGNKALLAATVMGSASSLMAASPAIANADTVKTTVKSGAELSKKVNELDKKAESKKSVLIDTKDKEDKKKDETKTDKLTTGYTIEAGDSLWQIASNNKMTLQELLDVNKDIHLKVNSVIHKGDIIKVVPVKPDVVYSNGDTVQFTDNEGKQTTNVLGKNGAWKVLDQRNNEKGELTYKLGRDQWVKASQVSKVNPRPSVVQAPIGGQTQQAVAVQNIQTEPNAKAGDIVGYALQLSKMGIPYVWGGESMSGMDCSGFTDWVFRKTTGKVLGHYTVTQESHVASKPVSAAQPGDLLFWGAPGATYHVAIYIGNNQFVAAPEPGQTVQVQTINGYFMPSFAGTVL